MKIKSNIFFNKYLPNNKFEWRLFITKSFFILFASLCLSINSFIDNLMIVHIPGAIANVGYVNVYTWIIISTLTAISIVSSILVAQYFGAKKFDVIQDIIKIRIFISLFFTSIFFIIVWSYPEELIKFISRKETVDIEAIHYLKLISIYWMFLSCTFHIIRLFSEIGKVVASAIISVSILLSNIIINYLLIHVFKLGITGAGVGTILSLIFSTIVAYLYIYFFIPKLFCPWRNIFKIQKMVWKKYTSQTVALISQIIASNLIICRVFCWSWSLKSVGPSHYQLSIIDFLSIISSVAQMLTANLYVIDYNIHNFIGKKLGQNRIKLAKINADKVLGFNFLLSLLLSFIVFLAMLIFIYSGQLTSGLEAKFITNNNTKSDFNKVVEVANFLKYYQTQFVALLFLNCAINPVISIILTEIKIVRSGGNTNYISLIHATIMLLQLIWLIIITAVIIPNIPWFKTHFWCAFLLFFLTEIIKCYIYLLIRKKINWAQSITKDNKKANVHQQFA